MKTEKLTVVIADDEPITRMDLRELLLDSGYEVVAEAGDGFDALEACRKYQPDIVLMDIKMPLLDGLSAAKMIVQEDLTDAIILLTAYREMEFIDEAKKIGVNGYLVKPIDEKSLIPSMEVMLSKGREIKRLRKDIQRVSSRLENRGVIERAKGRVMREKGMTEEEAYIYIRNLSLQKGVSMRQIADIILQSKAMAR
ncbi:ANTAR domain-containing response regulator [Synergistes jonesii]|uniref:Fis family transcriptional regulator n=1 Tax=Synergistes jonesii TaxID=2754 RepID=A0A073IQY2_9BACT|nr:response regulator [Synergistes jonesii]KEJ92753.1 Fis family transcriptional regulator [Synergistes jonesii]OFB62395.1 Fis family transcriptional regulator [Synergistes jonesii]OFB63690.1 Fis family transcriptional regulator [Synergistes jonesii]OFB65009.1 Fis family transcriptional regulator [Synergistes jonesii]OFB68303.1 Fis family transcriptional regulator [Synergistes jonesii]